MSKKLVKAARALARSGQPVFPCFPSGERAKEPMTKRGFKDASTDEDQIKAWWTRYPDAAIGFPTGIKWDVLDVDVKNDVDGRVHLPSLHRLGLLNGCKRVAKTPSGGWHLYFRPAPGLTNKARAALGLDVRSLGGYAIAPPSYMDDGHNEGYYVSYGKTKDSTDDPLWWDLIVNSISPTNTDTNKPVDLLGYERRGSLASLRGWLSERTAGERNNSLHWAVCRCIDNGIDPNELADVALLIGLTEGEVTKTIGSALKRAGVKASDLMSEAEALFGRA